MIPSREEHLLGKLAKKHKVTAFGYPLSHEVKNNRLFVMTAGYLVGENKKKKDFIREIKKDKRLKKIEMTDDSFGFWLMEQYIRNKAFFDSAVIHVKPSMIDKEGNYYFELASWDRKKLEKIVEIIETGEYNGKIYSFKQEKIKTITITSFLPKLTEKQKRAIELAVENGYYGYPRKTEIRKLAKSMKVSYSTYQFHLRNAEKKIMPFLASSV